MEILRARRKVIKGNITRLETTTRAVVSTQSGDYNDFEVRLERLLGLFQTFDEIQKEIELASDEDELETELSYRGDIEERYYALVALCRRCINQSAQSVQTASPTSNQEQLVAASLDSLSTSQQQVANVLEKLANPTYPVDIPTRIQLPHIQLPSFGGDYREWQSFNDLFCSIIDTNKALTPAQKFQYLKSSLTGEAASVLRHLAVTEANYLLAFNTLKSKYDKRNYIIESHLRTLHGLPALKFTTAQGLRDLVSTFLETVNALTALKLPVDKWDDWLIFLMVAKLDADTEQLWRREAAAVEELRFECIMKFLENRVYELTSVKSSKEVNVHKMKQNHSLSVLQCYFCKANHPPYACPKFIAKTIQERQNAVRKQGLCFNCLKGQHLVNSCKSTSTCRYCGKKHHTMLHNTTAQKGEHTNRPSQSCTVAVQDEDIINFTPTAMILIKDANGQLQMCRALLDSGSQVNLISESCMLESETKLCRHISYWYRKLEVK